MKLLLVVLSCVILGTQANIKPKYVVRPAITPPKNVRNGIIGGKNAFPGQFPYQVAIVNDWASYCGGSIISSRVVMTAAHCASGCSTFEVRAGVLRNEGGQVVISKHAIVHENYDYRHLNNDIALIMLPEDLTGENIGAVRLPSYSLMWKTFAGRKATVTGWGHTSDSSNSISKDLKFADVIVISNEVCAKTYGSVAINYSKICADTNWGTAGVCYGDSGGPMTMYEFETDGKPTQIGIASFVAGNCQGSKAHGFTRVTAFLHWIERNGGVKIRE